MHQNDSRDLRKRADARIAADGAPPLDELSPDQVRELVHELRRHQIELEMQNEELRKTQIDIESARDRYAELYDFAPVGYCALDDKGMIREANLTLSVLLRVPRGDLVGRPLSASIHPDSQDAYYTHFRELTTNEARRSCELRIRRPAGVDDALWAGFDCAVVRPGSKCGSTAEGVRIRCAVTDVTERRQQEQQLTVTSGVLRLLSLPGDSHAAMCGAAILLRDWIGCEAVGVRWRDGDDFPYVATDGFADDFVRAEKRLCALDERDEMIRDSTGNPVLECMCGNVLCGRVDPGKPFFTRFGSFWTNSTTELLASTSERDRQARTRNRCNGEGYESVALIPLHASGETFGLLQLNDKRKGLFTPERIASIEHVAPYLAAGLLQRLTSEALRRSEAANKAILSALPDLMFRISRDGVFADYSAPPGAQLAFPPEHFMGRTIVEVMPAEFAGEAMACVERALATGTVQLLEYGLPIPLPDGEERTFEARFSASNPDDVLTIVRDVTERKAAEQRLATSYRQLAKLTVQMEQARENERRSLARELHDQAGQLLAAVDIDLHVALHADGVGDADARHMRLTRCIGQVRQIADRLDDIMAELRPAVLDDLGLADALAWLGHRHEEQTGVAVRVDASALSRRLSTDRETALFRIAQEALTNVVKHSRATRVTIQLREFRRSVRLTIKDNGVGFDPDRSRSTGCYGLLGMRERAAGAAAEFSLRSAPGKGTTITVKVTKPKG